MEIEADRVDVDDKKGVSVFKGNVYMNKGSMHIRASVLTVYQTDGEIVKVIASGKPVTYKVRPDNKQLDVTAQANHVEYHARKDRLFLVDNAKITQGKDSFSGNRIEYDIRHDVVLATKALSGKQRPKIVIQPRKKKSAN